MVIVSVMKAFGIERQIKNAGFEIIDSRQLSHRYQLKEKACYNNSVVLIRKDFVLPILLLDFS